MSDFYANANGIRVLGGSVLIPYYGAPEAEIRLATADTLTNPVTLTLGNLTLRCAVYRQKAFAGTTTARLVGGAGGWGQTVPAQAYANPAGVKFSLVLRDVAALVGESVTIDTDRTVGLFYVREAAPAQRVLRQLAGELWWIDPRGVTRVGARPATSIESDAVVAMYRGGDGWLEVGTSDPVSWLPGTTYSGPTVPAPITVASTRFGFDNDGKLRLEVLTTDSAIVAGLGMPTASDRTMVALRALMRAEDPQRVPAGIWEYQVQGATSTTFDGSPTEQNFPLPPVVGVPYRSSFAGATCTPTQGTLAYVAFANQDPTRPILIAFGPTTPVAMSLDANTTVTVGASSTQVNLGGAGAVALATAAGVNAALTLFSNAIVLLGGSPVVWGALNTTKVIGK